MKQSIANPIVLIMATLNQVGLAVFVYIFLFFCLLSLLCKLKLFDCSKVHDPMPVDRKPETKILKMKEGTV